MGNINFQQYFQNEQTNPREIIGFSVLNLLAQSAQVVIMPLFIKSFKNGDSTKKINPYSVVFICSLFFAIFFMSLHLYQVFKNNVNFWINKRVQFYFWLIGTANAFNGLFTVYSSPDTRTPADIQGILCQFSVPFTFLVSYYIRHTRLIPNQMKGAIIVGLGIIVSFVPMIKSLINGEDEFRIANLWWSLLFIFGLLAGSLMNVVEDHTFKKFADEENLIISKGQMLAWMNFYQVIMVISCFWADIIPGFGVTHSIHEWAHKLRYGFECIIICKITWLYIILFSSAYIVTYISGAYILRLVTANYNTMWNALVAPLSVTFWVSFPSLNSMKMTPLAIVMDYISVVVIGIGIYWYVKQNEDPPNEHAPLLNQQHISPDIQNIVNHNPQPVNQNSIIV